MDPKLSSRVLVALSAAYGITVGILATLDSPAMTTVAVVGAMVLGGLWVIRGLFVNRDRAA